jgi:hypothetical protein
MKIGKFKLFTDDLDKTINFLVENMSFDYENHSADMSILASEEYYFRNESTQMNMIIAKKVESYIIIDVMGGAGGTGVFNISWGSEKGYIKTVNKVLNRFTEEYDVEIQRIEEAQVSGGLGDWGIECE